MVVFLWMSGLLVLWLGFFLIVSSVKGFIGISVVYVKPTTKPWANTMHYMKRMIVYVLLILS